MFKYKETTSHPEQVLEIVKNCESILISFSVIYGASTQFTWSTNTCVALFLKTDVSDWEVLTEFVLSKLTGIHQLSSKDENTVLMLAKTFHEIRLFLNMN